MTVELGQRQLVAALEVHAPCFVVTEVCRGVVDGRDSAEVAGRAEGNATAHRLIALIAKAHDVLYTQAERRTRDRIMQIDTVPVGGELEALEGTGLRRKDEPDGRGIGLFRLQVDVAASHGRHDLRLVGLRDW